MTSALENLKGFNSNQFVDRAFKNIYLKIFVEGLSHGLGMQPEARNYGLFPQETYSLVREILREEKAEMGDPFLLPQTAVTPSIQHQVYTRHLVRNFTFIISFNLYHNPLK
jgi:hypothetical protein